MTQAPRGTATAPEIAGYTYVRPIGHGGFSDVYLYEQTMPRRQVAIKVLRTDDLSEGTREQFAAEANLMARVSNHSNIAAIYAADVDDEGQPFLVMEFCSGGSLGAFYRHYPMSVKDVLSLGIRMAGALEAAHRAGIVHRDIKPANILLTEYGVPVLSDFGISTIDEDLPETTRSRLRERSRAGTGESSVGMSLPWAAPETLWDDPVSDARSDRYSLAATLYSLLEGRSPHEVPGGPNSASHLAGRIQSGFVGSMKRPDLPASLVAILRRGLAHDRAARFDSTAEMGRALQDVQRELGIEVTPLEVPRGGEIAARPPEVGAQVQQRQPIQLPEGHATLLPPADPLAAGPLPAASAPQPAAPPPGYVPSAGWSSAPAPVRPWEPPPGVHVSGSATTPGASGGQQTWRVVLGVLIAVLLVGCVVVASLLIARANADPTYSGREVDNLEWELGGGGVYDVTIPPALPVPGEVQSLEIAAGTGEPPSETDLLEVSTDTSNWLEGQSVSLNPMESQNLGGTTTLTAAELAATLDVGVDTFHEGDVLLVAAPPGYFANLHPDLDINYSEATLVIITVVDLY